MSNNQKKIDADNLSRVNGAFKDMSAELQNKDYKIETMEI